MELRFFPVTIFRETPKVTFFDTGINKSNCSDLVIHSDVFIKKSQLGKQADL